MTTKASTAVLSSVQTQPSPSAPNGPCQPPRKRTVVSPHSTTIPAYSASRNSAKRRPVYSVYAPKMISASATGMSKGGRWSSASPATKNTTRPGSCQSNHHGVQAAAMAASEMLPAPIAVDTAASTKGSSYASSWAATRRPPSSENLLALDHPAISEPTTPMLMTASAKKRLGSIQVAAPSGDSGMTASTTRYGMSATAGASRKTGPSA